MLRDLDTYGDKIESKACCSGGHSYGSVLVSCVPWWGTSRCRPRDVDVVVLSPSLAARLFRSSGSIWTDRSESSFELQSAGSTMHFEMTS